MPFPANSRVVSSNWTSLWQYSISDISVGLSHGSTGFRHARTCLRDLHSHECVVCAVCNCMQFNSRILCIFVFILQSLQAWLYHFSMISWSAHSSMRVSRDYLVQHEKEHVSLNFTDIYSVLKWARSSEPLNELIIADDTIWSPQGAAVVTEFLPIYTEFGPLFPGGSAAVASCQLPLWMCCKAWNQGSRIGAQ
jgi:hypothetical protein